MSIEVPQTWRVVTGVHSLWMHRLPGEPRGFGFRCAIHKFPLSLFRQRVSWMTWSSCVHHWKNLILLLRIPVAIQILGLQRWRWNRLRGRQMQSSRSGVDL